MQSDSIDPIVKRAIADGVLQRAARELDKLLEELAAALDPFPFFMGTSSIQALEIDPAGVADPKRGCGRGSSRWATARACAAYDAGPFDTGRIDQSEEFMELDLAPGDYVAYAYAAAVELARILEEREG